MAAVILCKVESWFLNLDLEPIMQEHNVWFLMGVAVVAMMKQQSRMWTDSVNKEYIRLGIKLSGLTQWTPYIRRNPSHWITICNGMREWVRAVDSPYLSVFERIWGVKYTGTYQFMKDSEKTFAWALIAVSIVWEGFDFSSPQALQDLDPLIRYTISTASKSHYRAVEMSFNPADILISPSFRATFYTPLGDALFQAAKKARDMITGVPTQSDNQLDLDSSQQGKTQILRQGATILDEMGHAFKLESEGDQVDRGDERAREYWDNLRAHFEGEVDQLEESLNETPETGEISHCQ
jgi:hypothetical protein